MKSPLPNPKAMLARMLNSKGKEVLIFQAEIEQKLFRRANQLLEATGTNYPIELDDSDERKDTRTEELQLGIMALANDDFPKFYAMRYAEKMGVPTPSDVAAHADLSEEEWEQRKEYYHHEYPEDSRGDNPDETTEIHLQSRFGISLEEMEREIVYWDSDEKKRETLGHFFGGNTLENNVVVFTGLDTVDNALETVTQSIENSGET